MLAPCTVKKSLINLNDGFHEIMEEMQATGFFLRVVAIFSCDLNTFLKIRGFL